LGKNTLTEFDDLSTLLIPRMDDLPALVNDPSYIEQIRPDEELILDRSRTAVSIVRYEEVYIEKGELSELALAK
jgi:hypothetical protein